MLIACALQVFVFPPGTSLSNGPFHFVNGSQGAASVGKLRWLFDRTRGLTSGDPSTPDGNIPGFAAAAAYRPGATAAERRAAKARANLDRSMRKKTDKGRKPTTKVEKKSDAEKPKSSKASRKTLLQGPYADATHVPSGVPESSIRFEGFDPRVGGPSVGPGLTAYGLALPMPILVPEEAASPTLVIADTSGLHYRGFARPGAKRMSARLEGSGGGCGGCIPRFNVFACEYSPELC